MPPQRITTGIEFLGFVEFIGFIALIGFFGFIEFTISFMVCEPRAGSEE
jgi:hypothetical protein